MTGSRIAIAAGLAFAALGLAVAFSLVREPAQEVVVPRRTPPATGIEPRSRPPASTLARLELTEKQHEQIGRLTMREWRRIEGLERALVALEHDLRVAELAQPFDAARVNRLVAHRAELAAYLRGTESRVVSEIAALLTPDQQRLFVELRVGAATPAPRARALPSMRRAPRAAALDRRCDTPESRLGNAEC